MSRCILDIPRYVSLDFGVISGKCKRIYAVQALEAIGDRVQTHTSVDTSKHNAYLDTYAQVATGSCQSRSSIGYLSSYALYARIRNNLYARQCPDCDAERTDRMCVDHVASHVAADVIILNNSSSFVYIRHLLPRLATSNLVRTSSTYQTQA